MTNKKRSHHKTTPIIATPTPKYKVGDYVINAGQMNWGKIVYDLGSGWRVETRDRVLHDFTTQQLDDMSHACNQSITDDKEYILALKNDIARMRGEYLRRDLEYANQAKLTETLQKERNEYMTNYNNVLAHRHELTKKVARLDGIVRAYIDGRLGGNI